MELLPKAKILYPLDSITEEQWLEVRRTGIGGSDIGSICGLNPYRTALDVYLDKIGEGQAIEENEAMLWGKLLEDPIAQHFGKTHNYLIGKTEAVLQSIEKDFVIGNIDRYYINDKDDTGLLEVKTTAWERDWEGDNIPAHYQAQFQWYLYLTGLNFGHFACLIQGRKYIEKEIQRDNELIDYLLRIGERFWKQVKDKTPPATDGTQASTEILKLIYPEARKKSEILLPDSVSQLLQQYYEASTELDKYLPLKTEAENKIKQIMGDNELGKLGELFIKWTNCYGFDEESFKKDYPVKHGEYEITSFDKDSFKIKEKKLYEQYKTKITSRRLYIPKNKGD